MLLDQLKIYNDAPITAEAKGLLGAGENGTVQLVLIQSLDPESGTLPANYQLAHGASVTSVTFDQTLDEIKTTLTLEASSLQNGQTYHVTLQGLKNEILTKTFAEFTSTFTCRLINLKRLHCVSFSKWTSTL